MTSRWEYGIATKTLRVGVIGLGYVGLPLAHVFWQAGFAVTGFDIDPEKIVRLKAGESYIKHFAHERVAAMMQSGRFAATDDFVQLKTIDAILYLRADPAYRHARTGSALSWLRRAKTSQNISAKIVWWSLNPPPIPARHRKWFCPSSKKRAQGIARFLARLLARARRSRHAIEHARSPRSSAASTSPRARDRDQALRSRLRQSGSGVVDAATAEAVKLTENIFRCVNIALVNELKIVYAAMGIDVWEVIDAAKTKPFGFMPFYPGPGLGGHCIPIDPFYLTWKAREFDIATRFIELAGEINTPMPRLRRRAPAKSAEPALRTALKGAAHPRLRPRLQEKRRRHARKPGVAHHRNPARFRREGFLSRSVHSRDETHPRAWRVARHGKCDIRRAPLQGFDAALIVTDHDAVDYDALVTHSKLVVDTRNVTKAVREGREKIVLA